MSLRLENLGIYLQSVHCTFTQVIVMSNIYVICEICTYCNTFCLPFLIVINTLSRVHERKSIFSMLMHKRQPSSKKTW
jgi:hypothetical protein